jgi:hypothetical protein
MLAGLNNCLVLVPMQRAIKKVGRKLTKSVMQRAPRTAKKAPKGPSLLKIGESLYERSDNQRMSLNDLPKLLAQSRIVMADGQGSLKISSHCRAYRP